MMNLKDTYAGVDPILTTLAQGYMLPETNIANFIAPVVDTPTRAGQTGEERFASMFAHPRSAINEARLVREFRRSIGALETHLGKA